MVYAVVQEFGVGGMIIATLMAGFILIAMGFARLGNLLKFVPYPLIVGFTSGIAVIIFSSQIKDFFGFPIESVPARSEEHTSELQSRGHLVCRLLLEKKKRRGR